MYLTCSIFLSSLFVEEAEYVLMFVFYLDHVPLFEKCVTIVEENSNDSPENLCLLNCGKCRCKYSIFNKS